MNKQTHLKQFVPGPVALLGVVVLAGILATGQQWTLAAAQESDDAVSAPEAIENPDSPVEPAPQFEERPRREGNDERRPGPPRPPSFQDIDTNNDSVITPEEFGQFRGPRRDEQGRRPGPVGRQEDRKEELRDHSNPRPIQPSGQYQQGRPGRSSERGSRDHQRFAGPPPQGAHDERRPPRGEFNQDRPPRREFNSDRPQRREFDEGRPPRADVGRQRSARQPQEQYGRDDRGYDGRPPRADSSPRDLQRGQERRPSPPRFRDLDTDGDGSISPDEFDSHHVERQRNRPPRGNE